mgnify:CR=1 FL=1
MLGGCTSLPLATTSDPDPTQPSSALSFWDRALAAEPAQRAGMLRNAKRARAEWAEAMLLSLPPDGDDLAASMERLRAVERKGVYPDQAALIRLRLSELQERSACNGQIARWRARVNQIVEIEQDIRKGNATDDESNTGR